MAHWQNRPEEAWQRFQFNQPYSKGLVKLKEVLETTDFDPTVLWQWGTMQAMALIEMLKENEATFGEAGQQAVYRALRRTGLDVGRQILKDVPVPEDMTPEELTSFYATVINRIAYASLEDPKIDGQGKISFDIIWCPHQDHYEAFDCRVQRYFVQGMIDAATEHFGALGFEVRFDTTIPSGGKTCHFTLWQATEEEKAAWEEKTQMLEKMALAQAQTK